MLANTLSEVVSSVVLQPSTGSAAVAVLAQGVSQAYDRDKQGWIIKTDCHSDSVRLHMVFKDIHNVPRNHLRKEITALQAENYGLERQLFSYQKSIAYAHSRGAYSDDMVSPEGREEEDDHFYQERHYSLGDRSLSTDTEYA
ncbi:unnamed protein product [Nesidiocoris tenuis]|uniref:Uncharacterized protein n=1 Tax=Nesidiocoris tenuis TaxID=355587 RepID=A0A6H5HF33_9HEMI|nr:unnamed protein product [Nesidiocoris tenuis]